MTSLEGSYLPSNRNSPESVRIENAPLVIHISNEQFNSILVFLHIAPPLTDY